MTLGPRTSSRPGWPTGSGAQVSGSTMRTLMPGSGWPIVPRLAPIWRKPAARKSCVLTATAGEHSVQP